MIAARNLRYIASLVANDDIERSDGAAEIAIVMHLACGSVVWIRQRRWRVERVERHRAVLRLDVVDRERRQSFLVPFDRPIPATGRDRLQRVRRQAARHRLAALLARAGSMRVPAALIGARLSLLPYQLEPMLALQGGVRRVLIADEVGLGKTIQASVVIAELHRLRPSATTLVMVPAALRDQWQDELRERFDLNVNLVDRTRLENDSAGNWQRVAGRCPGSLWRRSTS